MKRSACGDRRITGRSRLHRSVGASVLISQTSTDGRDGVPPAELCVVGDADQSIYAFRGATIRNIEEFERDYPDAKTVLLEQNYRSTQTILDAANRVIARNGGRRPKRLWTDAGAGAPIVTYVADDEHDEARFVADEIDALVDDAGVRPADVAVFYRTNAQSRSLAEIFVRVGLPYTVVGSVRFYERREIRDAIAYLRAIANPDDDTAFSRVVNFPTRGIGARSLEVLQDAAREVEVVHWIKSNITDIAASVLSLEKLNAFADTLLAMRKQPDVKHLHETGSGLDGSDERLLGWISDTRLACLMADNPAVELVVPKLMQPQALRQPRLPLHEHCLFKNGIHLGELWWLTPLAHWLRNAGRSRFLLTAPPLRLPGAAGSPVTPIATV